jgi:hypothetical protein
MRAQAVTATPSRAYVASAGTYPDKGLNNGVGLRVFDTSGDADPKLIGAYDAPGSSLGVDVTLAGTLAFLRQPEPGTRVLDVSDPTHPTEVALVPLRDPVPALPTQRYQVRGNQP